MPESRPANEVVVLTAEQIPRTLTRIAHEILEKNPGDAKLAVVGIHTRGAFLGDRIHKLLCEVGGRRYDKGALDISFYRDDVAARGAVGVIPHAPQPVVKDTDLPFDIDGTTVILVDDVLFTGRTIRAAIDALFDYVVNLIESGEIVLVVNTPFGRGARSDGYEIRATEAG